jgi:hypothetical protein
MSRALVVEKFEPMVVGKDAYATSRYDDRDFVMVSNGTTPGLCRVSRQPRARSTTPRSPTRSSTTRGDET